MPTRFLGARRKRLLVNHATSKVRLCARVFVLRDDGLYVYVLSRGCNEYYLLVRFLLFHILNDFNTLISKNFLVNISESYSLSDMFILKFFSKNNFYSKKLKYLIYTSLKKRLTIFFKKYLAQINVFYVADDIETWRLLSSFLECVLRRLPWDCFVYLFLVRRIRGDKWYVAKVHLIAFELFLLKIHGSKEPFHVRKTNRVIAVRSVWILAEGCLNV